jgi:hypothetical protein
VVVLGVEVWKPEDMTCSCCNSRICHTSDRVLEELLIVINISVLNFGV